MAYTVKMFGGFEGDEHADGFVEGVYAKSGTASITTAIKHGGSRALRVNPVTTAAGSVTISPPANDGELDNHYGADNLFVSHYFRYETAPSANWEIAARIYSSGDIGLQVCLNSSGNLELRDGSDTLLGTSSTTLSSGSWYLLEYMQRHSDGFYQLKIDRVSEVSGTSSWSGNNASVLYLGKFVNKNGETVDFLYDDYVVCTGDYVTQPHSVEMLIPDTDGFHNAWTGGYAPVDEVPPDGDTTYAYPTAVGQKQTVYGGTLSGSAAIGAVRSSFCCRRSFAGDRVQILMRSNGTDQQLSVDKILNTSYNLALSQVELTDFGRSGIPWAVANVEALEYGMEHTVGATPNRSRWSQGNLHVLFVGEERRSRVYSTPSAQEA